MECKNLQKKEKKKKINNRLTLPDGTGPTLIWKSDFEYFHLATKIKWSKSK